jgi:hypothetical protein
VREPIKRKCSDAQVSRVVLMSEDINYMYAKDRQLRKITIAMQLGHSATTTGCIDTRFESVYQSQRNTIGSTIIGDQIREIFQQASGRPAADGVADGVNPKRVKVGKLRAVLNAGPNEIGSEGDEPSAHRFRRRAQQRCVAIAAACQAAQGCPWHCVSEHCHQSQEGPDHGDQQTGHELAYSVDSRDPLFWCLLQPLNASDSRKKLLLTSPKREAAMKRL